MNRDQKAVNKPIIAVDVDDVLSASNEGVRQYINRTFGMNHSPEEYLTAGEYHRYWQRLWGVDEVTAEEWYQSYLDSSQTFDLLPIPGAIDAIKRLEADYDLVIVTSRDAEQIEHTKQWLQHHLPGVFRQVEFTVLHPSGPKVTKAEILKELQADYLIDDNLDYCIPAQEAGIQTLLFGEYGWVKEREIPPEIVRVMDWPEVLEYFDELAK